MLIMEGLFRNIRLLNGRSWRGGRAIIGIFGATVKIEMERFGVQSDAIGDCFRKGRPISNIYPMLFKYNTNLHIKKNEYTRQLAIKQSTDNRNSTRHLQGTVMFHSAAAEASLSSDLGDKVKDWTLLGPWLHPAVSDVHSGLH
ncbi:hypothetical protein TNIN_444851 [Trichonephila inaurata madagascariensis]|uniref:Uncharacterized protein n=1 Tax=Trichonephila inaurata madagascariensis TaxID=2747483 RepID=A0A8X7CRG9_9ARAC|nr:hypothetical protein TNIN_444851 [Trichonephila inaurata madagascariensis]